MKLWRNPLAVAIVVMAAGALWASSAAASISPTVSLDQSAGTQAAATQNLGVTINFAPSSASDTPKQLTIQLPPGLLANANVDNGACLTTAPPSSPSGANASCKVGTGTASASAVVVPATLLTPAITAPATINLSYYLVAPPNPGDLAGLYITGQIEIAGFLPLTTISLGTGDVALRPSGDPNGVGLTISLALPQTAAGFNASVSSIASTFDGLRYPSTCPSTPAQVKISASSYADPTVKSASAPLQVTGCNQANYNPTFSVTAVKDTDDNQVKLTADIHQPNALTELASGSTSLTFPTSVLAPNLSVASELCSSVTSGTCTPIGSATATSAVYPTPLTGKAYLTGSLSGLDITLVFPSPFALTLTGSVNLSDNSTTFSGLPDIPLTDLQVTLNGGANGAFATTCQTSSGTATATLVAQGGAPSKSLTDQFTVSGWKACAGAPGGNGGSGGGSSGGGSSGGGSNGGSGGGGSGGGSSSKSGRPRLSDGVIKGLLGDKPGLRFTVTKGEGAGGLETLTIGVTEGLRLVTHKVHGHPAVKGVTLKGAKAKSLTVSHRRLVIVLSKPTGAVTVSLSAKALRESRHLHSRAEHHGLSHLGVSVTVKDTAGKVSRLHMQIRKLGLPKTKAKK